MLIRITSAKCIGIESQPVTVEVNISNGIGIHLVGLADTAVKESLLRTVTALQSVGFKVPGRKIVINLAPADIQKRGSGYDLPIALGIIAASEQMEMPDIEKYLICGELGLDGTVRPVPGALPFSELAGRSAIGGSIIDLDTGQDRPCILNLKGCILPFESAEETLGFSRCPIFGVRNIAEALEVVCRREGFERLEINRLHRTMTQDSDASNGPDFRNGEVDGDGTMDFDGLMGQEGDGTMDFDGLMGQEGDGTMDFADIVGQDAAKRGVEIAASGGHHLLLIGAPGSGKSSLAKAMCRILPPLTPEEALQTCKIYSVAGKDIRPYAHGLRPFRAPHVSASIPALIGGGSDNIAPGEISLAHNGVLFLDEFLELPKRTIEVLRAPLEDHKIVLSRLKSKVTYPASFTLVTATNPCPCGYYGEGDRCTCTVGARQNYLSKLSGPISDRIDLQIWLKTVPARKLMHKTKQENSAEVARRVAAVRRIQEERFKGTGIFCNAQMDGKMLERFCPLDEECKVFLEKIVDNAGMSARAMTRIIKIARTIADMDSISVGPAVTPRPICVDDLAEAASYRFLDKRP